METPEKKPELSEMWGQDEYHFHGQRANEHVLLVRNQHWVVVAPSVISGLFSLLLLYLIVRYLDGTVMLVFLGLYMAMVSFFVGRSVYAYVNGVTILSDQRILTVDQRGFFNKRISEAELPRIQDVSSESKGVWQSMFHFGDVTIRTASKDTVLILRNIGDPYDVQQAIVRALNSTKEW